VIIGGGLAGLSTGCYARVNGWRTTIVEHNQALGGVCTAWRRGPYTIDGCIHWLTGGPFMKIYQELGIIPPVKVRPIRHFSTYRHLSDGLEVRVTDDLTQLGNDLRTLAPEDAEEIDRVIEASRRMAELNPGIEAPPELATIRQRLEGFWQMRHQLGDIMHFRRSVAEWRRSLKNRRLARFVTGLVPEEAPAFFLLFILSYLSRGWLSRPEGGTARFRDALIERYHGLDGRSQLGTTVEEVLVEQDEAVGVRLTDGTLIRADAVVSTASAPETILRLLAGRYEAEATRRRLERWPLFQPIVLVSFGVARPMSEHPGTLILDGLSGLKLGGRDNEQITVRIYNDAPEVAPPGHTVVQVMAQTEYDWWAGRGTSYVSDKDAVAEQLLACLEPELPGLRESVRAIDVSTPLTFWRQTRSWRGAFEGWMPTPEAFFGHIDKTLPGLDGFYMAGQWVEPGGGVPTALMSGRQVVQILCEQNDQLFRAVG
jgi:phytoene dehydrogenase-like protein